MLQLLNQLLNSARHSARLTSARSWVDDCYLCGSRLADVGRRDVSQQLCRTHPGGRAACSIPVHNGSANELGPFDGENEVRTVRTHCGWVDGYCNWHRVLSGGG